MKLVLITQKNHAMSFKSRRRRAIVVGTTQPKIYFGGQSLVESGRLPAILSFWSNLIVRISII